MSIGQRIAQKRKELSLSQEALGEQLGVSRQSISKWESDAAMPEIEKLIAMSRLFSVSVGWLLGVEAEQEKESDEASEKSEELTENQLKMVEEIVSRYLAAQPKPMSKGRRHMIKIAVAVAAVCLAIGLFRLSGRLDSLDTQYTNLQTSVNNVSSNVDHQIGNIASRVEAVLKAQNNLTADYGVSWVGLDVAAGEITFSAYALPKTYTEGMVAVFLAECDGEAMEFPGQLGEGHGFSADMELPLVDVINISVVFIDGNTRQTQLLESFTGLYHRTIPEGFAEDTWQFDECSWQSGVLAIPAREVFIHPSWEHDDYYGADNINPADVAEVKVGLFKNRELVCWLQQIDQPPNYHGFSDSIFYAYDAQEIAFAEGDILCLATVITDEYGRTTVRGGMEWELFDGEETQQGGAEKILSENGESGYYRYDDPTEWGL